MYSTSMLLRRSNNRRRVQLWFTCLLSWAITILRCFIDIPQEVENIVDLIYYTVLGCMQTQHDIELKRQGLKQ